MEIYVQARESLVLFEGLLNNAMARRAQVLKEVANHRVSRQSSFRREATKRGLTATAGVDRG